MFDISKDYVAVKETYEKIAEDEIGYRELENTPMYCLMDSFNSALCILSLGKFGKEDYQNYTSGFKKIVGHILGKRLNPNNAYLDAAKIMFLSACLNKGVDPFNCRIQEQELLEDKPYNQINFVRKIDKLAFNYVATAIKIINS